MYMIMFISRNVDQASDMLDVWVKTGVTGVTILESAGMTQFVDGIREDLGIVFSLKSIMRAQEIHHRTLFSVIKDEDMLNKVIAASGKHVDDWSRPDVGVLFVTPVLQAFGLEKNFK